MLIAGIDEAGRGPCIGPMTLAIAVIEKKEEEKLTKMGITDSKLIAPKKRAEHYTNLEGMLKEYHYIHVEPAELNELMVRKSLNEIEAMKIAQLLNRTESKLEVVYIDSPDSIQENFGKRIKKYLTKKIELKTEHKADFKYPICGAASIIAKEERDKAIRLLEHEFGEIGSGYPHDAKTINFLKKFTQEKRALPKCARTHWETTKRIINNLYQSKLF